MCPDRARRREKLKPPENGAESSAAFPEQHVLLPRDTCFWTLQEAALSRIPMPLPSVASGGWRTALSSRGEDAVPE